MWQTFFNTIIKTLSNRTSLIALLLAFILVFTIILNNNKKDNQATNITQPKFAQETQTNQQNSANNISAETTSITPNTTDATFVNLIRNSSFENYIGPSPRQWQYMFYSTEKNTGITKEAVLTGSFGLKFNADPTGHFGLMQPETRIISNRAYTFSAFVKAVNVTQDTVVRLAFWDNVNNKYALIKTFKFSDTKDWTRITFQINNRDQFIGKDWFPMIEVFGLKNGAIYLEDVSLTEGLNNILYSYNAGGGANDTASLLGDGSVLIATDGTIRPAVNHIGRIGTPEYRFESLWLSKAHITKDGSLDLQGSANIGNGLNLNGVVLIKLTDNDANVFKIQEGDNDYMTISTANGQEKLSLGNTTTNPQIDINGGTSSINIGFTNHSRTINIGTGNQNDTINLGTGGGSDAITIGTNGGPGIVDIFSSLYNIRSNASATFSPNTNVTSLTINPTVTQTTAIDLTDPDITNALSVDANDIIGTTGRYLYTNWNIAANGDITTAGDVAVNGGDITSTASTFNLINQPTTVNFAQGATSLTMAATTGSTTIRNNAFINGNTTLGDAATDKVTFNAQVNTNILPDTDNTFDLGSTALRWRSGFFGTSVAVGATTTITDGAITQSTSGTGNLTLQTTGGTSSSLLFNSAKPQGQTTSEAFSFTATNNLAATDELFQLKDAGGDLLTILGDGNVNFAGGITVAGTATFNGPLVANNTFQLGDGGDTGVINTSDWDINATGDMTGIGALTMDGNFSQTGATTFSTGTGSISLNGPTTVTGTNTLTVGGNTSLNGNTTIGDNSTDRLTFNATVLNNTGNFFFNLEGSTDNGIITSLGLINPTANRQILLPDASGTILLDTTPLFTLRGTSAGNIDQTLTSGDIITIEAGTNIETLAQATDRVIVRTVNNPVFTTSVTSPIFTNTGATTLSSQAGDITIDPSTGTVTLGAGDSLTVPGNLTVSTDTNLNGNTTLGNAASDNITFTGRVASSILPNADNSFDLGSTALRWRSGFFGTSVVIGATTTITDGAITQSTSGTGNLTLQTTGGTTGNLTLQSTGGLILDSGNSTISVATGDALSNGTWNISSTGALTGIASVNGLTITSTTGTLTIANSKTLTINNTLTLNGTDATAFTLPSASDDLVGRTATQTLTNKTLTSPTITTSPTAAGATWADLGSVTTIDINGGSIDGTAIGATTAAAGTFTTLSSTGVTTLGNNTNTVAINSSDWDINATGDMTGIGALTMDGNFSQTGATTFSTGTGSISLNGQTTIADGSSFIANGNSTLGDATTDTVTFNARISSDILPSTDGTRNLGAAGNRWNEVWAANGTIQTSDARLKSNINNLNYGLDEVLRLRPVSYTLTNNNQTSLGFIAQEMQQVMPELVITGSDENKTLGLRYENLGSVLVKAIQQQNTQVKDVANKVEAVSTKLNDSAFNNLSAQTLKVAFDLDVNGNATIKGSLTVEGTTTLKGKTIFESVVEFFANTIFRGTVNFYNLAIFNKDTAGTATIAKGADHVYIAFSQSLPSTPMVNATISLDTSSDAVENAILNQDIKYIISRRTNQGFIIKLNKPAPEDITFSWTAIITNGTSTFTGNTQSSNQTTQTTQTATPTQTSNVESTPSAQTTNNQTDSAPQTTDTQTQTATPTQTSNVESTPSAQLIP